jgi:hypothetical protein
LILNAPKSIDPDPDHDHLNDENARHTGGFNGITPSFALRGWPACHRIDPTDNWLIGQLRTLPIALKHGH